MLIGPKLHENSESVAPANDPRADVVPQSAHLPEQLSMIFDMRSPPRKTGGPHEALFIVEMPFELFQ
jgi:hypothetical protein